MWVVPNEQQYCLGKRKQSKARCGILLQSHHGFFFSLQTCRDVTSLLPIQPQKIYVTSESKWFPSQPQPPIHLVTILLGRLNLSNPHMKPTTTEYRSCISCCSGKQPVPPCTPSPHSLLHELRPKICHLSRSVFVCFFTINMKNDVGHFKWLSTSDIYI